MTKFSTIVLNIFLLDMNFDKFIIGLYILFISLVLAKFLKKLKINNYVINKLFKLQVFVI